MAATVTVVEKINNTLAGTARVGRGLDLLEEFGDIEYQNPNRVVVGGDVLEEPRDDTVNLTLGQFNPSSEGGFRTDSTLPETNNAMLETVFSENIDRNMLIVKSGGNLISLDAAIDAGLFTDNRNGHYEITDTDKSNKLYAITYSEANGSSSITFNIEIERSHDTANNEVWCVTNISYSTTGDAFDTSILQNYANTYNNTIDNAFNNIFNQEDEEEDTNNSTNNNTNQETSGDIIGNVDEIGAQIVTSAAGDRIRVSNDSSRILYFTNFARLYLNVSNDAEYVPMSVAYLIIYVALIAFTAVFTFRYLKRVIYIAFLTLMAPMVALTYPLDKLKDRKSPSLGYVV